MTDSIEQIAQVDLVTPVEHGVKISDGDGNSAKDPETGKNVVLDRLASTMEDPFAPREGKALTWQNVNMTLKGGKNNAERKILSGVWGEVPAKETTAIMGPSGAGKTSLLNILAGRITSRGKIDVSSDMRLNNYKVDPTSIMIRKQIAFVAQDDSLQVTSTPREAIRFSAKLRLPRETTDKDIETLANRMLMELGLTHCADTIVGGALIKGISGGERKRTSVGVELVVKPALVFLDEPTSGLDSFSAVQLCQVLKKVANAGSSVLFTIHQPASEIFNSFDHLILLNNGRVMYQGAVSDVPEYFGTRGHPNPPNYNPADWIMNVAQSVDMNALDEAGFFPKDDRQMPEAFVPGDDQDELGITLHNQYQASLRKSTKVGTITQLRWLFQRELRNLKRDTAALGARFGLSTFLSILIGVIFLDVGEAPSDKPGNLQSHFGALVMVLLMNMFGTAQPSLLQFPEERPVFLREYSTSHYSALSYFMSRLFMEAFITGAQVLVVTCITYNMIGFQMPYGLYVCTIYALAMSSTALAVVLGCSVGDPKLATEMLPILFVPQMLFAGFFVTPDLIPSWLRWARYMCSLTYAVRLMLNYEFGDGMCGSAQDQCDDLTRSVEADPDENWLYWMILIALFVSFRCGALLILRRKARKFF